MKAVEIFPALKRWLCFGRPSGTVDFALMFPSAEALGYIRSSLRDLSFRLSS
jgi:hypothetical protein